MAKQKPLTFVRVPLELLQDSDVPMDTLAGEWESFRALFGNAPEDQVAIMRQAFYSGAVAMSSLIGRGLDCYDELKAECARIQDESLKKGGQ